MAHWSFKSSIACSRQCNDIINLNICYESSKADLGLPQALYMHRPHVNDKNEYGLQFCSSMRMENKTSLSLPKTRL